MPGTFSKANRPRRPGTYVNFSAQQPVVVPPSQGSIVAVPLVHSWGPADTPVLLRSYDEFRAQFGDYDTAGRTAVQQAFRGEGLPGAGGAGGVLAYRMTAAAGAKATRALANTATTPVTGVTLTGRYEGTKGNDLRVTVQDNAVDAARDDLVILDGTVEVERYTYPQADLAALVATINASSRWVTATLGTDGTALAAVTAVALTGGANGDTLTATEWTNAMTVLETERFGVLAPYNLTDGAVLTSLVTWAKNQNARGRRFTTVVGGAAGEGVAAAIARSQSINDPNFINVGVGTLNDEALGALSTAQVAPRIAGILAARGEGSSITFARLAGIESITGGAGAADIDRAYDAGVVVFSRDTYTAAPIRVEKALTTFTTATDAARPLEVFGNPKFVRTMQGIENDATEIGERPGIIGVLPVNDKTRNLMRGEISALLQAREGRGVIQPGWSVDIDTDPPASDDDEFVALRLAVRFSRSTEQIYLSIVAG